jgi:hypothetical protein
MSAQGSNVGSSGGQGEEPLPIDPQTVMEHDDNENDSSSEDEAPPAAANPNAPAMVPGTGQVIRPLGFDIEIPNLRNGSLVNIQQAAPKASMSALYHWPVVTGLPWGSAVSAVEYIVRACYAQGLHALGANITDAQNVEVRKKAIVLGAVRAGAAAAYKLVAQDMTRAELSASGMIYTNGRIGQVANGGTATGRWAAAQTMTQLDAAEEGVIAMCVYMGMAIPVLQGVSLVMTGHHYIPTTYGLFKGIKKQALGSVTPDVRAWVESLGETFDDVAFHKACHPVSPTLKRSLSKNVDVAQRLKASGHGSAAIRLPAVPSEASGGKAAIALLKAAAPTLRQMGHAVSWSAGEEKMFALEHAAEGPAEAAACDAVVKWVGDNSDKLAFCAGVLTHVHETTGTGRNTILAAYSIRRIIADSPASVSQGVMYARAAAAKLRSAMETGTFSDPMIIC